MNSRETIGHPLQASDDELAAWYTTAIGIAAQNYDACGGAAFDPRRGDDGLVRLIVHGTHGWRDRVAATMAKLDGPDRWVIDRVYTPHGWEGFLPAALRPTWGSGSLVRLAIESPRAAKALEKRYPNGGCAMLQFLVDEAGRGAESERFFGRLVVDCQAIRDAALRVYEPLRRERKRLERDAQEVSQRAATAKREQLLESLTETKRRRQRAKFDRRLGVPQ